ncbi:MAG TPA: TadE/TadG family type IV pilus assembly protein, partial [Anaerolineales bacterium]
MNVQKNTRKKNKAQAMVEFALVLPILLLLLYGILEAGRLLFIYSTIVTASRQAVRYGSATGQGQDYTSLGGPNNSGIPRYQDCYGIRLAAQRVDFLNAIQDNDIIIQWDNGPTDVNPKTVCDGSPNFYQPTNNSSRLLVTIDGDYLPIVPRIVGFLERSDARTNPIKAQSARTVLVSVSIYVTAPTIPFLPDTSTPTNTPDVTDTPTATNTPTSTFTLTPLVSNTPSVTPTFTRTLTATLSPTVTRTPTMTLTPTLTPTRVPSCNTQPGNITLPGNNTMTLTIANPNAWPISIQDVFIMWDSNRGHLSGNDKTLILQSASIGGVPFWTGSSAGP